MNVSLQLSVFCPRAVIIIIEAFIMQRATSKEHTHILNTPSFPQPIICMTKLQWEAKKKRKAYHYEAAWWHLLHVDLGPSHPGVITAFANGANTSRWDFPRTSAHTRTPLGCKVVIIKDRGACWRRRGGGAGGQEDRWQSICLFTLI